MPALLALRLLSAARVYPAHLAAKDCAANVPPQRATSTAFTSHFEGCCDVVSEDPKSLG